MNDEKIEQAGARQWTIRSLKKIDHLKAGRFESDAFQVRHEGRISDRKQKATNLPDRRRPPDFAF
jgi:hypothetical protein